jgi:hypothetical protein
MLRGAGQPTGKGAIMSVGSMICMGCQLHIASRRGLCDWCHRRTRRDVSEGKTTWAELERQGRVLPAEAGDYDTAEDEGPGLAAYLVGGLVLLGVFLFFAGIGMLLWVMAPYPHKLLGVPLFAIGAGGMLLIMTHAMIHCCGPAPPRRE